MFSSCSSSPRTPHQHQHQHGGGPPPPSSDTEGFLHVQTSSPTLPFLLPKQTRLRYVAMITDKPEDVELVIYKDDTKPLPPLQTITVANVELDGRLGHFYVDDASGIEHKLRAKDVFEAEAWVTMLSDALNKALEAMKKPSTPTASSNHQQTKKPVKKKSTMSQTRKKDKEGFLEMPSASRFAKWQSWYVRLRGPSLFYYSSDTKQDEDFEGEVPLDQCKVVLFKERRFRITPGGNTATISTKKFWEFQAPTPESAQDWVAAIEYARDAVPEPEPQQDEPSSDENAPNSRRPSALSFSNSSTKIPLWIIQWEQRTNEERLTDINDTLDRLYGVGTTKKNIGKVLNATTYLIEDIENKARECMPKDGIPGAPTETGREAHPQAFGYFLRFYHFRVVLELSQFLNDQSYEEFDMKDLLQFMDLITAYAAKFDEVLNGSVGAQIREDLPPFALSDNAENMADVFLTKLKAENVKMSTRVVHTVSAGGESVVERRLDGRLQTTGPTLLFNLLHESLNLGRVSGVKRLQANTLAMCATAMSDYLHAIINDMVDDLNKSESCRYVCAMVNDCWTVLEQLERLEAEQKDVLMEFQVDLDPLRVQIGNHATRCVEVLAAQALSDVHPVLSRAFTKSHLESVSDNEDVLAVCVATFDDYLEDFMAVLEPPFLSRFAKMYTRDVVGAYLARMAKAYESEGFSALGRWDVKLIKLDRQRLVDCLQSHFNNIDPIRMFGSELRAMDDVLDMLEKTPALIPSAGVAISTRDARLRNHVAATAKMCIDLVLNAEGSKDADRLAKELKGMVMLEIDKHVQPSPFENDALHYVELKRNPYVIMWPTIKFPGTITKLAIDKAEGVVRKNIEELHDSYAKLAAPKPVEAALEEEEARKGLMARQQTTRWVPPTTTLPQHKVSSASAPQPATTVAPVPPASEVKSSSPPLPPPPVPETTTTLEYDPKVVLQYRDPTIVGHKAPKPISCLCALRRISPTSTDLAFVRYEGQKEVLRRQVTLLIRVEFWNVDHGGPAHFGPDGVIQRDPPIDALRTANRDVEFCLWTKDGEKLHFTAKSATEANNWVSALRKASISAYTKWGTTFKPEEEQLLSMSVGELKAMAKAKGLDTRTAIEKGDFVRILMAKGTGVVAPVGTSSTVLQPPPLQPQPPAPSKTQAPPSSNPFGDSFGAVVDGSSKPPPPQPPPQPANPFAPPPALPPNKPVMTQQQPPPQQQPSLLKSTASSAAGAPPPPSLLKSTTTTTTAPAPPPPAPSPPLTLQANERDLIELQSQIVNGMMLLEDGNPVEAQKVFEKAGKAAMALNNVQLHAKATFGRAMAFRDQENMRPAAGPMFVLAATLFAQVDETSDRINAVQEAVDVYLSLKPPRIEQALAAMEKFDESQRAKGKPLMFEARIKQIKAMKKGG